MDQQIWKITLFAASRVNATYIYVRSINHRMKKRLWVDATRVFNFEVIARSKCKENVDHFVCFMCVLVF